MPGTVIGTSMGLGYPGTYSRNGDCVIAARLVKSTDTNNINFGDAVFLNKDSTGGTFSSGAQIAGAITAAAFAGIAVREVNTNVSAYTPQLTLGAYLPGQYAEALERGSVTVNIRNVASTAIQAGGQVYVRKTTGNDTVVGALEPTSGAGGNDGGNLVALTGVLFTTGLTSTDANGNIVTEITLLSRNNP
jgi:hypothetical protein